MRNWASPGAFVREKEERNSIPHWGSLTLGRGQGWVQGQGGEAGNPSPVPEVSTADMSEARAAQATGLHEVLGSKHEGPHSGLGHGLLRIQGLGDKEAATTRQV